MAIRGRRTRRGRGRGCSDPLQPSQSYTSPPQPPPPPSPHVSASPGVTKGSFDVLIKQQALDAHSTNPQLIRAIRGRRTKRGRGRGRSDPPQPSQSCTSPPPPPHASASLGEDEEMRLIWEKINHFSSNPYLKMAIQNRRIRHGQGRGLGDPPHPSQLCTSPPLPPPPPPPPPPPHASASPGIKHDKNKMQKQGLVKGADALKNKQKITAYSSNDNDEYYDYDDGEDEEIQLTREKINQRKQQAADANNVKKCIGVVSRVSNNEKMSGATSDSGPHSTYPPANDPTSLPSSGGSHVETDRRQVITVEAISNPRRFVPQTVTRDIISNVFTRMPTLAKNWRNYQGKMKDELFKDFMDKYRFASDYDRSMARTVWERTCMDRYPDYMKNARKVALKQANSMNLADTKGHGPKGMKAEVWDGLVDIWLKPEWKKKSDANRLNRAALPDSMLHTGGSISLGEHKRRMEAELKHAISFRDVYDRVHKKKDGEYVSQRSKNFLESYDTRMLEKYGEDSSMHPVVDSEVWTEVAGTNKRRALGGHSLDIGIHRSMATSSEVIGPSRTIAPTQEDIKEAVNTAMTSFVQSQLMPMLEPILLHLRSMHDDDFEC